MQNLYANLGSLTIIDVAAHRSRLNLGIIFHHKTIIYTTFFRAAPQGLSLWYHTGCFLHIHFCRDPQALSTTHTTAVQIRHSTITPQNRGYNIIKPTFPPTSLARLVQDGDSLVSSVFPAGHRTFWRQVLQARQAPLTIERAIFVYRLTQSREYGCCGYALQDVCQLR